MNSHHKLFEALTYGPRTGADLRQIVGAGFAARISEWNKAWRDLKIVREGSYYRLHPVKLIKVNHKKAYPQYYINGRYEWPAKQRKNAV